MFNYKALYTESLVRMICRNLEEEITSGYSIRGALREEEYLCLVLKSKILINGEGEGERGYSIV